MALFSQAAFLGQSAPYPSARTIVLPVEYDGTASYRKGAAQGPAAILSASRFLEPYDLETGKQTASVSTLSPIAISPHTPPEKIPSLVEPAVAKILVDEKFPLVLGGEHSISVGCVAAAVEKFGTNFSVLHFDAHADLREEFECTRFSHACFLKRARDYTKNTVSVGVRSLSLEEHQLIKKEKIPVFFRKDWRGAEKLVKKILPLLKPNVWVSLDLDVLDPAVMPSVGTPEPDGFSFPELALLLSEVAKKKKIIGADVVELTPIENLDAPDFAAAKLCQLLLGFG